MVGKGTAGHSSRTGSAYAATSAQPPSPHRTQGRYQEGCPHAVGCDICARHPPPVHMHSPAQVQLLRACSTGSALPGAGCATFGAEGGRRSYVRALSDQPQAFMSGFNKVGSLVKCIAPAAVGSVRTVPSVCISRSEAQRASACTCDLQYSHTPRHGVAGRPRDAGAAHALALLWL